jgi:ATP phosphoribosyltransferase
MLRIAVPNKGSLSLAAAEMLREAGYRGRRDPKELVLTDADHDIEFFFLRPRDIAVYVGSGSLDGGITGRDLLLDSGTAAVESMALGFAASTFRYAGLVTTHLAENGVRAEVVRLDGAVETAITLGVADVIADVVETGSTLRQQGLEVFGDPILLSEAVLIQRSGSPSQAALDVLARRLQGVITAHSYVMMDYDVRVELVEQACALTPGLESPTVSPLHDKGYAAVRAMVPRKRTNQLMDDLYDLGARAILITDISACRL